MPELPEVETVRRTLENFILNKKIEDIKILYPKIIDDDQEEFVQTLKNKTFKEIDRVGKYLIFKLEDVAFISHLRMEGKYQICKKGDILSKHDHVIFVLDEGMELRYNDVRKFGRMKHSASIRRYPLLRKRRRKPIRTTSFLTPLRLRPIR